MDLEKVDWECNDRVNSSFGLRYYELYFEGANVENEYKCQTHRYKSLSQ